MLVKGGLEAGTLPFVGQVILIYVGKGTMTEHNQPQVKIWGPFYKHDLSTGMDKWIHTWLLIHAGINVNSCK